MPSARDDFESTDYGSADSEHRRSLADLWHEAFLLIFHILGGNDPGHPDQLRKEIRLLLEDLGRQAGRHGHPEEDVKAARYAICSLIDEMILNSRWEFKDQWADRPLQLEYFGEHMAGERFFDLLDRIRKKGARKGDLLEVFCMSLILGFQGKYKLRGREELDNLIRDIVQETNTYRGRSSSLAPHWQIPEEPVERPPSIIPRWVLVTGVASLVLVIALFIILALWLNSDAAEAGSRMIL